MRNLLKQGECLLQQASWFVLSIMLDRETKKFKIDIEWRDLRKDRTQGILRWSDRLGGASGNRTRASMFCRHQRFHFAMAPLNTDISYHKLALRQSGLHENLMIKYSNRAVSSVVRTLS